MPEATGLKNFEAKALAFLEANAKRRPPPGMSRWGEGSDRVHLMEETTAERERAVIAEVRRWKSLEFGAGFGWITGPPEYGGAGNPQAYDAAYQLLKRQFDTPSEVILGVSLGMVAPTVLAHGTDTTRHLYLRPLFRADIVACQLFSEPAAGSDLASVQARAVRDGDEWIVNGQKVWTSGAHVSAIGEVLCRTNTERSKHEGLTAFIVDMTAPGVEVRPLRQMTGGAAFNEVFLTDVRIPDDHRLGDIDGGWRVALTTLNSERASIGGGGAAGGGGAGFQRVLQLAMHEERHTDPRVRQDLADLYIHLQVAKYNNRRVQAKLAAGLPLGAEGPLGKLSLTANHQRISGLVSRLLGPKVLADSGEWGNYAWAEYLLGVPGVRIAGGTDEIMKNVLSERVLGLPKVAE